MSEKTHYLFIYGTLRSESGSDIHQQPLTHDFSLASRASIPGRLYIIADYPGLLPPQGNNDVVLGEVYSFSGGEAQLAAIDEYECCAQHSEQPHLYTRRLKTVSLQDNTQVNAWVYFYNLPVEEAMLIRSGDFLDPF